MSQRPSPPFLRRRVGAHLRSLRKEMGLSMADAATRVDRTQGWLSKMETGHISLQPASVRLLLMSYGRPADEVEEWATAARESNEQGWWESEEYKDAIFEDFADYLSAEASVSRMSYFHVQLVPGPAQTPDYARALLKAHLPSERQDEVDTLVALRMARQTQLFGESDGPKLRVVLDDPAIRRAVGGPDVMRAQLDHLLRLAKHRTVDLRVLPLTAGAEAAVETSFIYLEFYEDPDFVYTESITSGLYIREPDEVQRHRITFERLQKAALSQKASAELIQKVMEDLK